VVIRADLTTTVQTRRKDRCDRACIRGAAPLGANLVTIESLTLRRAALLTSKRIDITTSLVVQRQRGQGHCYSSVNERNHAAAHSLARGEQRHKLKAFRCSKRIIDAAPPFGDALRFCAAIPSNNLATDMSRAEEMSNNRLAAMRLTPFSYY
jgi:hypothetical protein